LFCFAKNIAFNDYFLVLLTLSFDEGLIKTENKSIFYTIFLQLLHVN